MTDCNLPLEVQQDARRSQSMDELLNEMLFRSLGEARRLIDAWRHDYNHHRPHSKLGWLTPAGYAARWQQNEELEGRSEEAFNDGRIPVPAG
jgi:putative transposase